MSRLLSRIEAKRIDRSEVPYEYQGVTHPQSMHLSCTKCQPVLQYWHVLGARLDSVHMQDRRLARHLTEVGWCITPCVDRLMMRSQTCITRTCCSLH